MRWGIAVLLNAAGGAAAGSILWDGRLNNLKTSKDLEKWSWSNPVGVYQYYIHGKSPVEKYVALSPEFKNPADKNSTQGIKITIDPTAKWNSDMWRTELIPEPKSTKGPINKGNVFYHFSIKRSEKNAPSMSHEHQVAFFESHFTELKYGALSGQQADNGNLQWMVQGKSMWSTEWKPDVWHNVAYEIDFDKKTVGFWHSTGAEPLKQIVKPVQASTNSDGKDWHVGVLRLPRAGKDSSAAEDWYFSGVYIEGKELTKSVSGP